MENQVENKRTKDKNRKNKKNNKKIWIVGICIIILIGLGLYFARKTVQGP